jgi:hypothetical protein
MGVPKPLVQWTTAEWSRAEQALHRVLRGVGEGEEMIETMPRTLQMRRRISGPEFAIIGPAVDIRPRDERG